jgi:hypothetical protein
MPAIDGFRWRCPGKAGYRQIVLQQPHRPFHDLSPELSAGSDVHVQIRGARFKRTFAFFRIGPGSLFSIAARMDGDMQWIRSPIEKNLAMAASYL